MGFPNFQKGNLLIILREIKRSIKKQKKQEDFGWKDFWELSIVPLMLLSIILGPLFQ